MTQSTPKKILLVAGDVSGDMNMARLARVLLERHPDWTLFAVGGPYLGAEVVKSPGGQWLDDTGKLSAIGILAALQVIPRSYAVGMRMRKFVAEHSMDAAVLCDWGAFNCRQLDTLNRHKVPVLYYFPPGSWRQSGKGDLGIANQVERIATPFKWSAERLIAAGGNATWVGHPMLELRQSAERREELRREFGIGADEKLVALLPGSRSTEINTLGPRLAAVAENLREKRGMHFIVAAPRHRVEAVKKHFPAWIKIVPDRAADILHAADAAIVKSGSATLEAAVIGVPSVIVYDFPWIMRVEWKLLWAWKKIPFIGMPNIILGRMAMPELLGDDCTPEKISKTVTSLLEDGPVRAQMIADYAEIRKQLGAGLPKSATQRTAEILEEMLAKKS